MAQSRGVEEALTKAAVSLGATPFGIASGEPYDKAIAGAVAALQDEYAIAITVDPALDVNQWMTSRIEEIRATLPSRQTYEAIRLQQGGSESNRLQGQAMSQSAVVAREISGTNPSVQDVVRDQVVGQIGNYRAEYDALRRSVKERSQTAYGLYQLTGTLPEGLSGLPSPMVQRLMGLPSPQEMIEAWLLGSTPPTFEDYLEQYGTFSLVIPHASAHTTYVSRRI